MDRHKKPPRPFGLTLALLGSSFVFAGIPLFVILTLVYINTQVYSPEEGSYMGFNLPGLDYSPLMVYAATAIFFIVMAFIAWRGRHPAARLIFPLLTLMYAAFTLLAVASNGGTTEIDSMTDFRNSVTSFYLLIVIGTVIYVAWFMNRWSARAFYRGYYTPEDIKLLDGNYAGSDNRVRQ